MKRLLLPLNLQYFSEGGEGDDEKTPKVEFTPEQQAELDRIVKDRVARAKKKAEEESEKERKRLLEEEERKRMEENNEWKEVAESYKEKLEKLEQDAVEREEKIRKEALHSLKVSELKKSGYSDESIEEALEFLDGDDEATVLAKIEKFKRVTKPSPVDPSVNSGGRQVPNQKDGTELGKAMYERIKNKIR